MKKYLYIVPILSLFFNACILNWDKIGNAPYPVSERSTRLQEIEIDIKKPTNNDSIMILSDTHFGTFKNKNVERFIDYMENTNPKPLFCVILGDVTSNGTLEECTEFNKFVTKMKEMQIPVFPILGNHDVYYSGNGGKTFLDNVYPHTSYYRIKINTQSYYFLDNADGTLGKPQYINLQKEFAQDQNSKIIFTHYPIYDNTNLSDRMLNVTERINLIQLFTNSKVKHVFAGHTHINNTYNFGTFTEYIIADFSSFGFHLFNIE